MIWIAMVGGMIIGLMMGVVGMCLMVNLGMKRTRKEMVDWMAIQEPKLHKAFKEAGCDENIV